MYPLDAQFQQGPPTGPTPHTPAAGPTRPKFQMWVNVFETRRAVPEFFFRLIFFPPPIAYFLFLLRSAQAQVSSVRSPSYTKVRQGNSPPPNVSACGPRPHPEHINVSWRASRRGSTRCVCVCVGCPENQPFTGKVTPSLSRPSPSAR